MFIYLLCHLHLGITYWGFKPMSTVFQIYKGSIRWNLISKPYMGHFWGGVLQLFCSFSDFLEQLQNKPLEHS